MIGYDEALAIVCREARPVGSETVPTGKAHRRILAEPVAAAVDAPAADISAMDGFAIREEDAAVGRSLAVVGQSFPGAPFDGEVPHGSCVRIFTGAAIPRGLDRVVIQENVRREGDSAVIQELSASRHVRGKASDFRTGDILLEAGRELDARALVAAAGADQAQLTVWRRPKLALLGTGDELTEAGRARDSGGRLIPESLSVGVAALAEDYGGETISSSRVPDNLEAMQAAAAKAVEVADLVVLTGGASVGEKDFAKRAFDLLDLELFFSKVAIKPGKPVWFGRARGTLVMGLPGNPTSAMVTARLLLAPLVAGLAGRDALTAAEWRKAVLDGELGSVGDRETFVRARWSGRKVAPMTNQDSGSQKTLADADVLIRRRAGLPLLPPGNQIEIIDL